jgi:hypothetical protein
VHVLGHHHETNQCKLISLPNISQDLHKQIPRADAAEQPLSPITTERYEVQMPVPVNPNQFISHVQHTQRTAPLQPKVCGTRTQPHANHYSMIYRSGIMRLFVVSQERNMN